MSFEPIAIVGRACLLPGALGPDQLWQAVKAGKDLVGSAPAGRWRASPRHILGEPGAVDRAWTDRGGYVEGFERIFDPQGFALPAEQVLALDPLFQWLLHVSREALREAGGGSGPRVGAVFGNLSFPSAALARFSERVWLGDELASFAGIAATDPRNRFSSGLPAHLTARALKLEGGAFALDAACASSLYAIKLACDRLHDRSADLMLAGAVSCADDLFIHVGFSALQAISRTGQSRPFHREADGLLPAEGAGAVALKRLADAESAGDQIFGVIRGIGLSNDGRGRGLLVPDEDGQVRAMRAAYEVSGLRPADVSLVECHATGTTLGDAVEVRSMCRVFEGVPEVPIGSLKSTFGHAITAAGVAGLIKVLGAIEARVRPPTLHVEEPLEELASSPLRLIKAAEPWESKGSRRAAVSAFGFGGNNAHLLVEEHEPSHRPSATRPAQPKAESPNQVGIVAIGAAVGDGRTLADFERALFEPGAACSPRAESIRLPIRGIRFAPRDLEKALPQQTWLLAAAREALTGIEPGAGDRAGIFVGMGCDPEVARYGARWRLADWAEAWGAGKRDWIEQASEHFASVLEPASVLGTMPNMPANRLNVQLDFGGQGFTVSSEELSGVRALEIARRALAAGELDLALVGAADFSCEPVHEAALERLGERRRSGDGAVVLVLERVEDARRKGHQLLAVLGDGADGAIEQDAAPIEERFGRAHAAFGLIRVAAAALSCARGRRFGGEAWTGQRSARLKLEAMGGEHAEVVLQAASEQPIAPPAPASSEEGPVREYLAHPPAIQLPPLPEDDPQAEAARLRPSAPAPGAHVMPPAPSLPSFFELDAQEEAPAMQQPPTPTAAASRASPVASIPRQTPVAPAARPAAIDSDAAARIADQLALVAKAHRQFLESQSAAQARMLALQERAAQLLLQLGGSANPGAMAPPMFEAPPQPALALPIAHGPLANPPPTDATPSVQRASTPSPKMEQEKAFPGPKLDRAGLQIHASGKISEIYGPAFARQDGFARQVRMPEPPLLLADRLLGIDAEPGAMGLGTLWTETDVRRDSWYLHEGRMPAGIMIEAGQADLMLISYLGIDWLNQGERVYRLLGCDLTYHGSLPAPGDTLRYDIHVDGHAQQGEVRLFFFHYDCRVGGQQRLTVRNGQAGFFTGQELDDSKGVLWDAATAEHRDQARLDPPRVACGRTRFSREQIEAFADGRVVDCFGPGFEISHTQTRAPRISGGRMLFLDEVTELSTRGGPWGRGYLRATQKISPDSWFFQGHFKNDPCMPGTLMFEGCLQAMAFYLASLGYTLDKDAWRFEPVPEETYKLRCRGQATPQSKEVVYEVFVEEVVDGPVPTLWADLLCTVDGRKAFHCRRMGLRLVPGWPLDSKPELVESLVDSRPVASAKGFQFGSKSLLACAWGKPSGAFGPMYGIFDGTRRVPRLPGPPYQFMSRIAHVEGEIGAMQVGSSVEAEYDVPPDAWYFEANGARTMPFCVLLEAALQPCGWLASYVGSATTTPHDLSFRNLDGDGKLLAEILPDAGILRTRVTLTNISQSAGMIIESFDVACFVGERKVYELKTVFGFFPKEALEAQKGLPVPDDEREALEAPSDEEIELKERPRAWFGSGPHLAPTHLCMIDRLSGFWPKGGPAGLGRFRAEHDVRPESWFFKAHFFQDPVQPGSLGIEAMLQVLQLAMLKLGMAEGPWAKGRFEPIAVGADQHWKYRGQVLPRNRKVTTLLDLLRVGEDERGRFAIADASLWVDGLRIYEAKGLGMRIVRDGLGSGAHAPAPETTEAAPASKTVGADEELLDPTAQAWLQDHRPTFTVPALPLMSMVDRLASAASRRAPAGKRVVAIEDARALRWVPVPAPLRLRSSAEAAGADRFEATLQAWRDAPTQQLSRFEPVCSGRVLLADEYPVPEETPWEPPADARPAPDPYESGDLFHGPSFRLVRSLDVGSSGSSAILDAAAGGPARGLLHEALLDALTHGIPHDRLSAWSKEIEADLVGYPHRVTLRLFGPLPASGLLRLETRFAGFAGDRHFPRLEAQLISGTRLLAHLSLTEVLFPLGPVGKASPRDRRAFLRDHVFVEGVRLSADDGATTRLNVEAVRASDWLPGTVASAFACDSQKLGELAAKEHVSRRARVHPSSVHVETTLSGARIDTEPLTLYPLEIGDAPHEAWARDAGEPRLELGPVRDYWSRYFHIGQWPVEDLYFGLAERFVRRVHIEDPAAFAALRGRPILYLGNHQVGIESLMFSLIAAGLSGVPTVTLAKAEHRTSWLGLMIQHAFTYPGAHDPRVITYFQRDDPTQLPVKIAELAEDLKHGRSAMVHVEGTRALTARHPVIKMSGAFLDMSLAIGAPVVPVRFIGGLPVEPLARRIELPIGMGQQEIWLGRPILPEELAPFPYKERKEKVISAINALGGIPNSEEQPFPGDDAFDAKVRAWAEHTGASCENAALLETLRALPEPHPEFLRLLEGASSGRLVLGDGPKDRWLADLAHRLFGDHGPKVVLGAR